jgi:glycosyltransferase involved in cell wall biosynthesis
VQISIALCTYNGARFLEEQLASLVSQNRRPDELVVCDDCSTDSTVALLRKFATDAPFPVHIHENQIRLGSTKNFERAISLCQGEVIALCDQDDIWVKDKLSFTEQCFVDNPNVGLVFTDASIVDEKENPLGYNLWASLEFDHASQAKIKSPAAFELLSQREIVTGATMSFRTKFRDLILPIPEDTSLIHDGWIALIISLAGSLDFIDRPLIKYRQHDTQQIGASRKEPSEIANGIRERAKRRTSFTGHIKKLEAVRERMVAKKDRYEFKMEKEIDHQLKHMYTRVSISQRRLNGIPAAIRELFAGRYHRYSSGFYSLIKDLVQ